MAVEYFTLTHKNIALLAAVTVALQRDLTPAQVYLNAALNHERRTIINAEVNKLDEAKNQYEADCLTNDIMELAPHQALGYEKIRRPVSDEDQEPYGIEDDDE